jgi:hypothetical protein
MGSDRSGWWKPYNNAVYRQAANPMVSTSKQHRGFKTVFSFPERSLVTIVSMQTILIIRLTTGGFIGDNPACFKDLGVQRVEKGGAVSSNAPLGLRGF